MHQKEPTPVRNITPIEIVFQDREKKELLQCFPFIHAPFSSITGRSRERILEAIHHVIDEGQTYPYDKLETEEDAIGMFFAFNCIVCVLRPVDQSAPIDESFREVPGASFDLEKDADLIAGIFYIKPNYPGRSSHNCNGGFLIFPSHRGRRLGRLFGLAYLHYAPRLGYRGSVFNLVYETNVASSKIWDALGFERAGRIPEAGLLKFGDTEKYVDALIYYKVFPRL